MHEMRSHTCIPLPPPVKKNRLCLDFGVVFAGSALVHLRSPRRAFSGTAPHHNPLPRILRPTPPATEHTGAL